MPAAVMVTRLEHSVVALRLAASRARDADAARRMLAIALVLEGRSRSEAAPDEIRACLEAGMDGHVSKPIDRNALLRAIAEATRIRA